MFDILHITLRFVGFVRFVKFVRLVRFVRFVRFVRSVQLACQAIVQHYCTSTHVTLLRCFYCTSLKLSTVLYCTVLSLYLYERRGVQGNTSIRSREFPRAQPEGTPETECWYFLYSPT